MRIDRTIHVIIGLVASQTAIRNPKSGLASIALSFVLADLTAAQARQALGSSQVLFWREPKPCTSRGDEWHIGRPRSRRAHSELASSIIRLRSVSGLPTSGFYTRPENTFPGSTI